MLPLKLEQCPLGSYLESESTLLVLGDLGVVRDDSILLHNYTHVAFEIRAMPEQCTPFHAKS